MAAMDQLSVLEFNFGDSICEFLLNTSENSDFEMKPHVVMFHTLSNNELKVTLCS